MPPKKAAVMGDDDFNMLISQGTKQLKLSSFNENKLQSDNRFQPMKTKPAQRQEQQDSNESKTSNAQGLLDFLNDSIGNNGSPQMSNGSQGSQDSEKEKKGTFGKLFSIKKLKSKVSDPKLKASMEKLAITDKVHNNISSPVSPMISDDGYSPGSQVNRNTNHNAGFIEVESFSPVRKNPSKEKGVTFRDAVSEIGSFDNVSEDGSNLDDYYDSYASDLSQDMQQRPNFGNRGSSLKNLEHISSHKQVAVPEPKPIQNLVPETVPIPPSRMDSLPRGASLAKGYQSLERTLPATPNQRRASKDLRLDEIDVRMGPRPQRSADLQLESKPQHSALASSRSYNELDTEPKRTQEFSRAPLEYKRINEVQSKDQVTLLKEQVAELKALLQDTEEENTLLKLQLVDQKKGFDKLSAQAYKKIKGLLTDRNIMSIEIESLKSQVMVGINFRCKEWNSSTRNGPTKRKVKSKFVLYCKFSTFGNL